MTIVDLENRTMDQFNENNHSFPADKAHLPFLIIRAHPHYLENSCESRRASELQTSKGLRNIEFPLLQHPAKYA